MARLTIDQIQAPDLSVASLATSRAGEAFQTGVSTAQDLLGKYQAGLEAQGDKELTNLLAGAKDEVEYDELISSIDFSNMNLSAAMRENIINGRGRMLGYEQNRADTGLTVANTGLANANTGLVGANTRRTDNTTRIESNRDMREGRTSDWEHGGRVEQAGLASLILADAVEGSNLGYENGDGVGVNTPGYLGPRPGTNTGPRADGSGIAIAGGGVGPVNAGASTRDMLARTLQMEAGNQGLNGMIDVGSVIRNRAASGRYGDGIEGVIMRPGQFSAWNGVTGYAGGEQGQSTDFTPNEDAYAAADAILSGQYEDRTGGATHYYAELPNSPAPRWTNGSFRRIDGDHYFGDADGVGAVNGNTGPLMGSPRTPVTQAPNQGGPARDALLAALSGTQFSSPEDVLGAFNTSRAYAEDGETAIKAADAEAAAAAQDEMLLDLYQNPDILTGEDAMLAADAILPGSSATEQLANIAAVQAATGEGGPLSNLALGTTGATAETQMAAAQIEDNILSEELRNPIAGAIRGAQAFEASPAESLVNHLRQMNAEATIPADLEGKINQLALEANITPGEAAYAFARASESAGNQNFLVGADGWLTFFGDGLPNRSAMEYARQNFSGDRAAEARNVVAMNDLRQQRVAEDLAEVDELKRAVERRARLGEEEGDPGYDRAMEKLNTATERLYSALDEEEVVPSDRIPLPNRPQGWGQADPSRRRSNPSNQ